jgi:hypothetical protein
MTCGSSQIWTEFKAETSPYMQDAWRRPNHIKLRAMKPTAHVKKTLSLDVWSNHPPKNVPLFGYDMVEMWLLWALHTSWCIQVSRNVPHASGENTDCYKSQLRADMLAWAPSSNAHIYIRTIFCCTLPTGRFLHVQCCTEQSRYGNVHTTHKWEAYQNRNLSDNCAKKRPDTQMTVYQFP